MNTKLSDIEPVVAEHAKASEVLQARYEELERALEESRRRYMPGVKRALARVAELDAKVRTLVKDAASCFVRPKTVVMHGTRVGLAKGKGKLNFDKPEKVVQRIERLMPEKADLLIHTEKTPNKEALAKLSAAELKRLGCEVTAVGDVVVVQPVDGELKKMIKALLKDASKEGAEQADDEAEAA